MTTPNFKIPDSVNGGGHTIQDETTDLPRRSKQAFVGAGVTATDDATGDRTVINIDPVGGGGAGLTWQIVTAATNLDGSNGYLLNSAGLEHTLPPSATLGEEIQIIGVNGWQIKTQSGLVYLPNNTSNTGIKSASGFAKATALLRSLGGANWMAMQSEGLELYAYATSGPGATIAENYRVAMLAAGYTMSGGEITALTNYVNALNIANVWSTTGNTFALYPLLGTTQAQQKINAVTPGTGDLATLDGSLTYNSNGFTGNGSIYADVAFMDTHWTTSNFRSMFAAFSGVPSGSTSPIYGTEAYANRYLFRSGTNGISLGVHTGNNEVTSTSISFPFNGIVGAISRADNANVVDRSYINGVAQPDTIPSSRNGSTNRTGLRMLKCNGIDPPSGAICKGFICIKSAGGLSNTEATAINSAFSTFLTAIGR